MFKKLVLIIPPSPWLISDRDQPMMGPLYISSFLRLQGFNVQVCDLAGIPEEHWHIPVGDIYGITGTSPNFPYMKKIINGLKERELHKMVVVGGVHATVLPNHILNNTFADICVVGEGEITMSEIMHGMPLTGIQGIVTRKFRTGLRPIEKNIDIFPFPDRESIDYYDYLEPQTYKYLSTKREGSIITGRGCPYKCSYCASNMIHNGKVRFRSAKNVYDELKYLHYEYDIRLCNFVDDTFILNKKRVSEICDLIEPLGIEWFFLTRVDHVDLDLFKKMKGVGCISVTFGFESGSNKVLSEIKKNTTIEQAYKAIEISKKVGFKIRGQMMVGVPGESWEDVEMTAKFIESSPEVDTFGLHVFQPYPGCDIWRFPESYNCKLNKYTEFEKYHTIGKPGVALTDNKEVQKMYDYLKEVISKRSIELQ